MTQVTGNAPDGTPNWLDIGVPDLERAKTFYGTLLGWQFQDTGPEGGHYNMCTLRGEPVAGMAPNPDDRPARYWWTVYFATGDCDGLIKRVPSKEDRRKVHIFLTAKRRKLRDKLIPCVADVNAIASRDLDPADIATLRRVLLKMSENLAKEEANYLKTHAGATLPMGSETP